jgi:hypothetical protein
VIALTVWMMSAVHAARGDRRCSCDMVVDGQPEDGKHTLRAGQRCLHGLPFVAEVDERVDEMSEQQYEGGQCAQRYPDGVEGVVAAQK